MRIPDIRTLPDTPYQPLPDGGVELGGYTPYQQPPPDAIIPGNYTPFQPLPPYAIPTSGTQPPPLVVTPEVLQQEVPAPPKAPTIGVIVPPGQKLLVLAGLAGLALFKAFRK